MGKNKKRGKKEGSKPSQTEGNSRWDVSSEADLSNAKIEKYYQAQKIVAPEEWDEFYSALKKELPATFRITGTRTTAQDLNHVIETVHVPNLQELVYEGRQIAPPTKLAWYPEGLAWQLNVSRTVIRRNPELKTFHNFLIYETETGSISRQEAVSMIPPLLLGVQPHHYVLDMCAAPGSKTAQLIEALHANDTETPASSFPPGLVIANDSDYKRANLLVHQSARLPSPAVMVTNLDAAIYPQLRIPRHFGSARDTTGDTVDSTAMENLLFDRILCDVPCSGDGTIRKNLMVWRNWQVGNGNGLHSLQLRILQRAMRMLKGHGRIVYSTCSLNPVENEAVVAAALTGSRNQFTLVDVSSSLPELKRRAGLRTWSVAIDKEMTMFDTWEQYITSGTKQGKVVESMFAPVVKVEAEEDNTARSKGRELKGKDLHLERCLRIYPHLQNTGGFFVAVLERMPNTALDKLWEEKASRKRAKPDEDESTDQPAVKKAKSDASELERGKKEFDAQPEVASKASSPIEVVDVEQGTPMVLDAEREVGPATTNKSKGSAQTFKENPYTYLTEDNELLANCLKRLRIRSTFALTNLFVRNPTGEAVRSMYLCSDVVKAVVQHNDFGRIRLITCGTKVFTRQESGRGSHQFRILDDGVSSILPHVEPEAVLAGDLTVLRLLLAQFYPKLSTFDGSFRDAAMEAPIGCSLVRFGAQKDGEAHLRHALVLPLWKSPSSLGLMVHKKAKSALSLRLFGIDLCASNDATVSKLAEEEPMPEEEPVAESRVTS